MAAVNLQTQTRKSILSINLSPESDIVEISVFAGKMR